MRREVQLGLMHTFLCVKYEHISNVQFKVRFDLNSVKLIIIPLGNQVVKCYELSSSNSQKKFVSGLLNVLNV